MPALTKSERQAVLLVSGVLLISIFINWIQPHIMHRDTFDYSLPDSLFAARSVTDSIPDSSSRMITRPVVKTETGRAPKTTPKAKSINLNTATQQQLEQLPRIGPATAKAIIEYRERNGLFQSLAELKKVKRVGPKTVELIAPFLFIESDSLNRKTPH